MMVEATKTTRIRLEVPEEIADVVESALSAGLQQRASLTPGLSAKVSRAQVKGQSIEMGAIDVVKLVVALGGGIGIATILKELARIIVELPKARRGSVKIQGPKGRMISLQNYTADEIGKILEQLPSED